MEHSCIIEMYGRVLEDGHYTRHDTYEDIAEYDCNDIWTQADVKEIEDEVMCRLKAICVDYYKDVSLEE